MLDTKLKILTIVRVFIYIQRKNYLIKVSVYMIADVELNLI